MARYFLNIHHRGDVIFDEEGFDFSGPGDAVAEAKAAARQILAEKVRDGQEIDGQLIEVLDEAGRIVDIVRFRDQIRFAD